MSIKYDKIGTGYDKTRKADPYIAERMYHLLEATNLGHYLDLGCGTGNYTSYLQNKGIHFTGIDPSKTMLARARERNAFVDWKIGHAENIPLPSSFVDGILCSLTVHHWSDINAGLIETARVLKHNAPIVIFSSSPDQMEHYWLKHYFPQMMQNSIKQMPSIEFIKNTLNNSGYNDIEIEYYNVKDDLKDMFLYCGKHQPEYYLMEDIRLGISTFSSLAHENEINSGLNQLKIDIESKQINSVIESSIYENGDYLFFKARKR